MKKISAYKSCIFAAYIIVCSIMFVFFFSCSTSPLYKYYIGGDSSIFLLIGREWASGKIPYRDMFDHKGPFIFMIDALGWLLTGTRHGVIILQIPCMIITLYFISKIASLWSKKEIYKYAVVFISLVVLTENYIEGNLTEEYCLPFLAASTYYFMRYFYTGTDNEHKYMHAFLYGVTAGVCLMTRATNAVYIGVASIIIAINLVILKLYKNLIDNIFAFLVGMSVVVVPFILYFWSHGSLGQFVDGTLLKNMEYAGHMASWLKTAKLVDYRTFLRRDFTALCIIPAGVMALIRKKRSLFFFCLVSAIMEIYILTSGAMFAQYPMIELPQVAIFINELMFTLDQIHNKFQRLPAYVLGLIILYASYVMVYRFGAACELIEHCKNYNPVGYEALLDEIPVDERDSFVSYGYRYFKEPYLLHDISFCNKYFVLQGWHLEQAPSMIDDLRADYMECKAKWILTADYDEGIHDIICENYTLYDSVDGFQLYRLK